MYTFLIVPVVIIFQISYAKHIVLYISDTQQVSFHADDHTTYGEILNYDDARKLQSDLLRLD